MVELTADAVVAAEAHLRACYPTEGCGLVAIIKGRQRFVPCRNSAASPAEHFRIAPQDWAAVEDSGEIVAVIHSHPDQSAAASEHDRVACEASGLPWYIVSVRPLDVSLIGSPEPIAERECPEWTYIEPSGYEAPLVGRSYAWGVLDCYALIRDWYRRERGILLPDVEREPEFWLRGVDLYGQQYSHAGFRRVADSEPIEPGDVLLFQMRSPVPNHAGVYIGDGLVLHHMVNRLSSRDVWGGYLADTCTHRLRYVGSA